MKMDVVALVDEGLYCCYLRRSSSGARKAIHNNSSVIPRNLAVEMLLVVMGDWWLWHTTKCVVVIAMGECVHCKVVVIGWIR